MNKGVQNLTNKPRQTGNVTVYELLISSLAQTDALAKLLIEKGLITRDEFMQKISEGRATYQNLILVDRQREYNPTSLADFTLSPNSSPMQFDKLLEQG